MTLLRIAMHLSFVVLVLLLFVLSIGSAFAHGGGIDAYGGHNDNKNGNYHAHQGTCAGRTFDSKSDAIEAGCKR
jgi:hypothetical protein